MATLVDSYDETHSEPANAFYISAYVGWLQGVGQCFTAATGKLYSAKFYLKKTNSPTGNASAKVYAYTGTPGVDAKPTGAALATSALFDVATLTTDFQLIEFIFSGAERIQLSAINYIVTFEYTGGDVSNVVNVGNDYVSPAHAGNGSFIQTPTWTAMDDDVIFYLYEIIATINNESSIEWILYDTDFETVEHVLRGK